MAIIQQSMDNIYNLENTLNQIETGLSDRITELEHTIFKQTSAPTTAQGANEGDIWYDMTTDTFNVYREYPSGSGVFVWEPVIYHNADTINGGNW